VKSWLEKRFNTEEISKQDIQQQLRTYQKGEAVNTLRHGSGFDAFLEGFSDEIFSFTDIGLWFLVSPCAYRRAIHMYPNTPV